MDDTGARHLGKNAYTTVIANPLFASFMTTESKSRVNFLKLLRAPHEEYVLIQQAVQETIVCREGTAFLSSVQRIGPLACDHRRSPCTPTAQTRNHGVIENLRVPHHHGHHLPETILAKTQTQLAGSLRSGTGFPTTFIVIMAAFGDNRLCITCRGCDARC